MNDSSDCTFPNCSILFPNAMENSPSKVGAMMFSLGVSILITPILCFVIEFERDNHLITLMNQLVSSALWIGILWNLIIQPLTFIRYIFGPLKFPLICGLDTVLRNGLCMHGLLLLDSIVIVRIIFLHYLKNPTALNDQFWILFINLWIGLLSFTSQTHYVLAPGKNPINYYMCIGHYPEEIWNQPVKVNWSMLVTGLFSVVLHIGAVFVKFKASEGHEEKSLFSKISNSLGIISLICISLVVPSMLNKLEPIKLDQYPNYLLLYVLHHYITPMNVTVIVIAYFCETTALRQSFYSAVKNWLNKLFQTETNVTVFT